MEQNKEQIIIQLTDKFKDFIVDLLEPKANESLLPLIELFKTHTYLVINLLGVQIKQYDYNAKKFIEEYAALYGFDKVKLNKKQTKKLQSFIDDFRLLGVI